MKVISDRKYAIVMLLFSIGYCCMALSLDTDFNPENEKFYPLALSIGMIGMSILLIIFPSDKKATWPSWQQIKQIIFLVLVILVYSLALGHVGFLILASILMGACMWLFGAKPKWIAPTSITVSIFFYVVFDRILGLNLPAGILEF